jgi:GNAT superfamily N-acetyltransferase
VVAVGGFVPADREAVEIRRMRVDPDHQRNGYGAAVLSLLEDAARRQGYGRAVLETHELLAAARVLYESQGYRETGRESGRDGYERIRYEKVL